MSRAFVFSSLCAVASAALSSGCGGDVVVAENGGAGGSEPSGSAGSAGSLNQAGTTSAGSPSAGGNSTGGVSTGGVSTGGVSTGGVSTGGSGGEGPADPYAPRVGSFKMLVYSATKAFRHDGSINTGKAMLQQIGAEQGFEVVLTETNDLITPEGLAQFEIVFFMNSTGDIFNETQEATYEEWMTTKNGAFGGVHSATDTESGWDFYAEVTGQYYNGHSAANQPDQIQLEATLLDFPALKGLPNPWQRNEEWYKFDNFQAWSVKPGFKILGKKAADGQPIMWARQWGNFRSFYSAIGHDGSVFQDPEVKKHVTGGIMWAVRRESLIK